MSIVSVQILCSIVKHLHQSVGVRSNASWKVRRSVRSRSLSSVNNDDDIILVRGMPVALVCRSPWGSRESHVLPAVKRRVNPLFLMNILWEEKPSMGLHSLKLSSGCRSKLCQLLMVATVPFLLCERGVVRLGHPLLGLWTNKPGLGFWNMDDL